MLVLERLNPLIPPSKLVPFPSPVPSDAVLSGSRTGAVSPAPHHLPRCSAAPPGQLNKHPAPQDHVLSGLGGRAAREVGARDAVVTLALASGAGWVAGTRWVVSSPHHILGKGRDVHSEPLCVGSWQKHRHPRAGIWDCRDSFWLSTFSGLAAAQSMVIWHPGSQTAPQLTSNSALGTPHLDPVAS